MSPIAPKRVRFSPDVKDSDYASSSSRSSSPIIPASSSSRRQNYPSPQSSSSSSPSLSSYDIDVLIHSFLLPPQPYQRNPHIVYEARAHPRQAFVVGHPPLPLMPEHHNMYATQPPMRRMHLVSRHLRSSWAITVDNAAGVRIGDILTHLHKSLHQNVFDSDYYGMPDDSSRVQVLLAYQRNCSGIPTLPRRGPEGGMKRIDWLKEATLFVGIQKDEDYTNTQVADRSLRPVTFVMEFRSP